MKTQEYLLIYAGSPDRLGEMVQRQIDKGFRVHGSPFYACSCYTQAVVKEINVVKHIDVSNIPSKSLNAYMAGAQAAMNATPRYDRDSANAVIEGAMEMTAEALSAIPPVS